MLTINVVIVLDIDNSKGPESEVGKFIAQIHVGSNRAPKKIHNLYKISIRCSYTVAFMIKLFKWFQMALDLM